MCVWMSCSHAMIILCGVCTEQTVFAPSFSAEQSVHCVMCRATAVIMAIMSSPGADWQLFYGEKQRARHEGRKREKKGNTPRIDLCTFAYLYHFLIRFVYDCEIGWVLRPVALAQLLISTSVYLLCCHRNSHPGKPIGQPEEVEAGEGVQVRGRKEERNFLEWGTRQTDKHSDTEGKQ